jgi:hypothetical protein
MLKVLSLPAILRAWCVNPAHIIRKKKKRGVLLFPGNDWIRQQCSPGVKREREAKAQAVVVFACPFMIHSCGFYERRGFSSID